VDFASAGCFDVYVAVMRGTKTTAPALAALAASRPEYNCKLPSWLSALCSANAGLYSVQRQNSLYRVHASSSW
jgi:hypothetical protein